jgi:two-component system phosphate regulon sensor histidine kinase PhoR
MESLNIHQKLSESERFLALSRIGAALIRERDESRLLRLIAQTAADLTGAEFAAFTLRPTNNLNEFLVPADGRLFYLAAVVGVTSEQEELFRHMPLGGEGLLAPIFRFKVPVRVADVRLLTQAKGENQTDSRTIAREAAFSFAHGRTPPEELRSIGIPRGHPTIRSFLGAPLLDSTGEIRGGLLLGHSEPDQFQPIDEEVLVGLAAQTAVALDNAQLYHTVHARAQEFQAIFESISDGVTLVNQEGQIIRENMCARRLREQLEQYEQGTPALEALLHAPARSALQGITEHDVSITIVDEQNDCREYVVNASPLLQPPINNSHPLTTTSSLKRQIISGAVVVWHDVTETRRLQRERRIHAETEAQRALLQRILDEMPISIYLVHGHDARLVLANQATHKVWGATWRNEQPMVDFLQKHALTLFHEDGRMIHLDELTTLRSLHEKKTFHQCQEIIRYADGSTLPVLVNAIPLDAHKHIFRISPDTFSRQEPIALVVHQDVSALKEADRLKDEFIGIAAHELRNPLAIVQGLVQLFQVQSLRADEQELSNEQQETLDGIEQATRRLGELMDDLLDVTRLQAGRLELHCEATNLVPLVKRVTKRLQTTIKCHHIVISSQDDIALVFIDVQRIEQVLTNIINNAVKYSPHSNRIEVSIRLHQEPGSVIVSVQDYGIGIPPDQQARIFGRFMRADNAQAQGIMGTGLGLYLSRELVERHNGQIWFHSAENEGSTFFISLPLLAIPEDDV